MYPPEHARVQALLAKSIYTGPRPDGPTVAERRRAMYPPRGGPAEPEAGGIVGVATVVAKVSP